MPKQKDLPGVEGAGVAPIRIPEIDDLAEKYFKEKEKRCKQTPKEIAAKNELVDALHRNAEKLGKDSEGVIRYQFDDMVVLLKPGKEKLVVKESAAFEEDDVT